MHTQELKRLRHHFSNVGKDYDEADLKRFKKLSRRALRPDGQLLGDLVAWIEQKENMCIFGAPWQADAQMVFLYEKYGWIEGIIRCVCLHECACVYVCSEVFT